MRDKTKENAHRIANVLDRYTAAPHTAAQLAIILNYQPEQLQEDAQSLLQYIEKLEAQE